MIHNFLNVLGIDQVSLVRNSANGLTVGLPALDQPLFVGLVALVVNARLGRDVSWA